MKIGIIAEGKGDCAVLYNILWTVLGDDDEIAFLRPEFESDQTDLKKGVYQEMKAEEFSSWTLVKKDCEERTKLQSFLIDDNIFVEERKILIQIDTAECDRADYGVTRPTKDDSYCTNLRQAVINQINTWLNNQFQADLYYAVCIEETEAWLLALYGEKDSHKYPNPKNTFQNWISKPNNKKIKDSIKYKKEYDKMDFLSSGFQKKKQLIKAQENNQSLDDFIKSF